MNIKEYLISLVNVDIYNLPPLVTYAWVFALSIWGGIIRYFQNIKTGVIERFTIGGIILEISTSAFSGIITYFLCEAADLGGPTTAALVGISGHMGSKILSELSKTIIKKIRNLL